MLLLIPVSIMTLVSCDTNPDERIAAGGNLYRQGEYRAALEAYQAAQAAAPDDPLAYYNAAYVLAATGQLERAEAALKQALRHADDRLAAKAYYNLGNIYFEQRDFARAIQAYQSALLLNPADDDARHNLELAQRRIVLPTPTPADTGPEPENTPDPTPDRGIQPAAPTPQTGTGTAAPPSANEMPTVQPMSREQADQLLEAIQRSQQTLMQALQQAQEYNMPTPEKNW
jgi:tetratricopeptide (TPR) repeat protein